MSRLKRKPPKNYMISSVVTKEEHTAVHARAQSIGLNVSTYLRFLIRDDMAKPAFAVARPPGRGLIEDDGFEAAPDEGALALAASLLPNKVSE